MCCLLCSNLANSSELVHGGNSASFITVNNSLPAGFEDLVGTQTTQADVYFGGEFLTTAFVDFGLTTVRLADPLAVVEAIPNLRDPQKISELLTGELDNHAAARCSRKKPTNCGLLEPQVVAVIFDDSRFRLDVFLHPAELLRHEIQTQRYLPAPSGSVSMLHNIRINVGGNGGNRRYSIASDSFLAHKRSRLQARYAITESGPEMYEMSWQRDGKDHEYEIGSFRTLARLTALTSEVDILGARFATSTSTRTDLEQAAATPIFLFLPQRSRIDVYRGNELLESRYYAAGNQQIDTSAFPDGAYDVRLHVVDINGNEQTQTQFFVRSTLLPPLGESQYFVEFGEIARREQSYIPRPGAGTWLRAGYSRRLQQRLAIDQELVYANGVGVVQSGFIYLAPAWHFQSGVLYSSNADVGYSVRGGFRRDRLGLTLDYRAISVGREIAPTNDFSLIQGDSTQGFATFTFPIGQGQGFIRARRSQRNGVEDQGFGFSYWGAVFKRRGGVLNFTFDSHFGSEQKWARVGLTYRWGVADGQATIKPEFLMSEDASGRRADHSLVDGRWTGVKPIPGFGDVEQSYYINKDAQRSVTGARFVPRKYRRSELELGLQRDSNRSELFYAMNNAFSIATSKGRTTLGDGGNKVGAVIVHVVGDLYGQFEVLVNDRVVGKVWAQRPNVISLRAYESYNVRIRPIGDKIVGYQQASQQITLYPGSVEKLTFAARELTVLVGEAYFEDGNPVSRHKFLNVEGYGATDEQGWFQVEVSHSDPLILEDKFKRQCRLELPEYYVQDGLAILDAAVCVAIAAQQ